MIDVDVSGISVQVHFRVNEDGSLEMMFGEGSVALSATDAEEMTTSKHLKLETSLHEKYLGAPLCKSIRDAIHNSVTSEEGSDSKIRIKNLSKSENMPDNAYHSDIPHKDTDCNQYNPECGKKVYNEDGTYSLVDWDWHYDANSSSGE